MKKFIQKRKKFVFIGVLLLVGLLYFLFFQNAVIGSYQEKKAHVRLEETKQTYSLSPFETDGCSGNVSSGWTAVIEKVSDIYPAFAERYRDTYTIPFESACVTHDRAYHAGTGGYDARLQADVQLRTDIISYATNNTLEIKKRTGLTSDKEVLNLYTTIAQMVYLGVRIGGAPCTTKTYAWGYGYNNGSCI